MKLHLRIFFSFMFCIVLLLSAIGLSMYSFQKNELVSALEEKLRITEQSITRIANNQKSTLTASAKTIAEDWGLRRAIGQDDVNTIVSALNNHRQRIQAENAIFLKIDGRVASTNGMMPSELEEIRSQLLEEREFSPHQIRQIDGEYFHVVVSEVKAPLKIGWLFLTYKLDALQKLTAQVSERNSVRIVVIDTQPRPRIVFTSEELQSEERAMLFARSRVKSPSEFQRVAMGAVDFIIRFSPSHEGARFQIAVFDSVESAHSSLSVFWRYMIALFFVFALLALLVTFIVAKSITRPLSSLVSIVKDVEGGDFSSQIDIDRTDEIGELATAFKHMQSAVSERKRQVQDSLKQLKHQAMHDTLTGLSNRRMLTEELERVNQACLEKQACYNICILDLDRFKIVNDTSGHAAGDALLVQIAQLLREAVYTTDVVVRLGGDEFALLLRDCKPDIAVRICNKIRQQIEELFFHWEGSTHKIGVSIGILSVSKPVNNTSEILQRADAGCFVAKENGRNQVHLVTDDSATIDEKRDELHWVQRLHTAIDNNELLLFAQPVVPLKSEQETERLEILVRLRNYRTGKLVPPGAFVPSAERYGLSSKIDRWVITQLLKVAPIYSDLFGDKRSFWVNLSGSSLGDEEFVDFLEDIVTKNLLPPGSLNFEITETAVIRNIKEASEVMHRLKNLGCRFALDDFGTGLSSFNYLKLLPVDFLKIDGMFIRNILEDKIDRMFVKSIIDIAHAMGLETVAEFVESQDILDMVIELGADYGQGFHLGRPQELTPQVVSQQAMHM